MACQPGETALEDRELARPPGDAARELAIAIDKLRPRLEAREWSSAGGDAPASFVGYAAGDTLRLVREVVDRGDRGRSAARYYFDGPQLRYYELEGDMASATSTASVMRKERLVLAFDEHGGTAEVSHLVDGAIAPVDSVRVAEVVRRAAEVARQWATTPPPARP